MPRQFANWLTMTCMKEELDMRGKVSFEEIGSVAASFYAGEGVKVGQVVQVSGAETVGVCGDGGRFCGVAVSVAGDGVCAVQVRGFVSVAAGADVAPGWMALVADGAGGVRKAAAAETGLERLVVSAGDGAAVVLL